MKIFVTGGAGYIGSVCAELLLDEGHSVSIFDNLSEGKPGARAASRVSVAPARARD